MKIFTYRFMWKLKGSDLINFKVITDTSNGLASFEEALLKLQDLDSACKEYLSEIDVSLIGKVDTIFGGK